MTTTKPLAVDCDVVTVFLDASAMWQNVKLFKIPAGSVVTDIELYAEQPKITLLVPSGTDVVCEPNGVCWIGTIEKTQ